MSPPRTPLTPLELLWSVPFGPAAGVAPLPRGPAPPLRAALEAAVLPALRRPPCAVSFSGGRDSSAVLAVATVLARREGLPAPVPVTHRFGWLAESVEDGWQELVVRSLGLREWQRTAWDGERAGDLDVLGPVARRVLTRHGVLPPFNLHFHEPVLAAAAGGSVLTGVGGDELFAPVARHPLPRTLAGRRPLRVAELPRMLAGAALPAPVRAARLARELAVGYPWLTARGERALRRALGAQAAREPLRWDTAARTHVWPGRRLQLHRAGLEALGAHHGVLVESPFCAPGVLAAAAARWGWAGPRSRAAELADLLAGDLPPQLAARESKSTFDGAFWHAAGREFAAAWDGRGLEAVAGLVDVAALREHWLTAAPDAHSFSLLQHAWLASQDPPAPPSAPPGAAAPTRRGNRGPAAG
ncbi:hypothetical protein NUM3379_08570 [Kineococcus sp. NUM-3379]